MMTCRLHRGAEEIGRGSGREGAIRRGVVVLVPTLCMDMQARLLCG